MRKKQPPTWLTGALPTLEAEQQRLRERRRVRLWLQKKRASSYGYRLHEAKLMRQRRADPDYYAAELARRRELYAQR